MYDLILIPETTETLKMKLQLLEEKKSIIATSLYLSYKTYLNIFETKS